jgi:hypothetical protein
LTDEEIHDTLVRMKRTNVVLDEHLLDDALRLSGERTYSAAINRALAEMVERVRARQAVAAIHGMGEIFWPGYPEEMTGGETKRLSMVRDAPLGKPRGGGGRSRGPR